MLPVLTPYTRNVQSVVNLRGLNLTGTVSDGEWSWTQNLDTRLAPMVRRREPRILIGKLTKPNGLCGGDALAFVDGTRFYYQGFEYGAVEDSEKTMIGMGSDIIIFPDRKIFSTITRQFRTMDQTNVTSGTVTVTLARPDGTPYENYEIGPEPPENPENGDLWLDTSEYTAVMKSWSDSSGMWVDEYTTCVEVQAQGIGAGFAVDDAVEVSGFENTAENDSLESLNGTWQLLQVGDNRVVFTGIIKGMATVTQTVTAKREAPQMDFVVEHNNRLWGCSSEKHEIYACALGDPTNWRRYAGISTDSYAVTVGSPGPFTGAAVVNSSVCFFKEDIIHKIYGTVPGNFQMTVDHYRGVEVGSARSLVRINELMYFKSKFDVCRYDGTEVQGISQALGLGPWRNAVCGANDRRLYMSVQHGEDHWELLTYDTETGYWMREDSTHAKWFANVLTETFMLDAEGNLWGLREGEYAGAARMIGPDFVVDPTPETDKQIPWIARTGEILVMMANNKRIGRIQLMSELPRGSWMSVRIKKDNEPWETIIRYRGGDGRRHTLPIWPRRCDRLMIEVSGEGPVKLINLSWLVEGGSEHGRE